MRITNGMLSRTLLSDVARAQEEMSRISGKMASGRAIERPSDDPFGTSRTLELTSAMTRTAQYVRGADDARTWLEITDQALGEMSGLLDRARELAIRGANSTFGPGQREGIALEIDQLVDAVKAEANASYAGRYVFGGTRTDAPPYIANSADDNYYGNAGVVQRGISPGVTVPVNVRGTDVLGSGPTGVLATLRKLAADLRADDVGAIGGADLAAISGQLDSLNGQRAIVGARANRLELVTGRLEDLQLSLRGLRSETADADLGRLAMDYSMRSAALESALRTGAKILQPTLIDFLGY